MLIATDIIGLRILLIDVLCMNWRQISASTIGSLSSGVKPVAKKSVRGLENA